MVTFDCGVARPPRRSRDQRPRPRPSSSSIDHHASNAALRHDQRDRSRRGGERRARAPPRSTELGLPLTRDAAVCLYAALVCDTGRFQYESTTSAVFELAQELAALRPPDLDALAHAVRGAPVRVPAARSPTCLQRAVLVPEKHFVWTKVTQADLARHGVTFEEVEGLIDSCAAPARPRSRAC